MFAPHLVPTHLWRGAALAGASALLVHDAVCWAQCSMGEHCCLSPCRDPGIHRLLVTLQQSLGEEKGELSNSSAAKRVQSTGPKHRPGCQETWGLHPPALGGECKSQDAWVFFSSLPSPLPAWGHVPCKMGAILPCCSLGKGNGAISLPACDFDSVSAAHAPFVRAGESPVTLQGL